MLLGWKKQRRKNSQLLKCPVLLSLAEDPKQNACSQKYDDKTLKKWQLLHVTHCRSHCRTNAQPTAIMYYINQIDAKINNLYSISMQSHSLLFQPIPPQDLQLLQDTPCAVECELFLVLTETEEECERVSLEQKNYYLKNVYLQIRGLFIVQFDRKQQRCESAVKTSLDLKIQIFKQLSLAQQKLAQNCFRLVFPKQPSRKLTFCCKNQESISQFINKVIGIPVIQLGFDKKNHYEPIRRIGKGSHAHVYESQDLVLQKKVAVRCFRLHKVFKNGDFKHSFVEEVRLLQLVNRQAENQMFFSKLEAILESEKSLYMVMQLLTRNLKAHILKFGFPLFLNCKKLMFNLAKALHSLHKLGIMHRDIKLQNIMLREDNSQTTIPVIVDFGIARTGNVPAYSQPCGTPGYIAPEIFTGREYSNKCDVFSMGVVYHYLLLGHLLFEGNSPRAVSGENMRCNIDYEFKRHPAITPEIRSLLVGMLRKQPQSRLTAQEVVEHVFFRDLAE